MSRSSALRLQPLVRLTLARLGDAGTAWEEGLEDRLAGLERRLDVVVRRGLPGGSTSHVVLAERRDGSTCVLKVPVPGVDLDPEARLLADADGRGYVRLLARDDVTGALVLEHAGEALERTPGDPEARLDVVADVLRAAWLPAPEITDPGEHPRRRAAYLADLDERLGGPLSSSVREAALAAADRLSTPSALVRVHGDPHPGNLLRALDGRGWVLVDPDDVLAEPASDAGVLLRGGSAGLLGPDAASLQAARVRRVSARLDLDPDRVSDWALLERVATGLHVLDLGAERLARPMLDSAAALVGSQR